MNLEIFCLLSIIIYITVCIFVMLIQHITLLFKNRNYKGGIPFLYEFYNFKFHFIFYKIEIFLMLLGLLYVCNQYPVTIFMVFNSFVVSNNLFYFFFELFIFINLIFVLYLILFKDYVYHFEYLIIYMSIFFFSYFLFFSTDLFLIYLNFEGVSLCSFILLSINYSILKTSDIGLKYFILSTVFSLIFLFDLVLIYINCGSTDILNIQLIMDGDFSSPFFNVSQLLFSFILIVFAIMFKLGLFPFHFWVVDIYRKLSLINLMYFSIYLKYIYVILFYKIALFLLFPYFKMFNLIFVLVSILSVLIASLGAIKTYQVREIISYSSILNMGFVSLSFTELTISNLISGFSYFIFYIFVMLLFFFILLRLKQLRISAYEKLSDFNGLYLNSPFYAFMLTIVLFSLAGLPPFIGFFYKIGLLYNNILIYNLVDVNFLLNFNNIYLLKFVSFDNYVLIVLFLLINLLSSFVYIRMIASIFFYKKISYRLVNLNFNFFIFIINFCFSLLIVFGIYFYKEFAFQIFMLILLDLFTV